jgi:hypothetical protein
MSNIKDSKQLRAQLLRNGYACDDAGVIETHREPDARFQHTHLAVIRIDAPKEFTSKVFAAVDEAAAIVGVSPTSAVMLFRVDDGGRYDASTYPFFRREIRSNFVLDSKKQCFFTATSTEQAIDVAALTWLEGRSPSTTHRSLLPPLFLDVAERVLEATAAAMREAGGRWGPWEMPETVIEKRLREMREKRAAPGFVDEPPEDADEELVRKNPKLNAFDGNYGLLVSQARARIAAKREATERPAKEHAETERKAKLKVLLA